MPGDEAEDKVLWYLNPVFPESLPKQLMQQGRDYDHHLIMEMTELPACTGRLDSTNTSVAAPMPTATAATRSTFLPSPRGVGTSSEIQLLA